MKLETWNLESGTWNWLTSLPPRAVIGLIRLYQFALSPLVGRACRFHPTCSSYMIEAIETHGLCRGAWLGAKRLLKCHPFHPGGVDLVPAKAEGRGGLHSQLVR